MWKKLAELRAHLSAFGIRMNVVTPADWALPRLPTTWTSRKGNCFDCRSRSLSCRRSARAGRSWKQCSLSMNATGFSFRPLRNRCTSMSLYQRSVADLARLEEGGHLDIASELSSVVSRAYAQIHSSRRRHRFKPVEWLLVSLPSTFRRQIGAFQIALAVTLFGCILGAAFLAWDSGAKEGILPFSICWAIQKSGFTMRRPAPKIRTATFMLRSPPCW